MYTEGKGQLILQRIRIDNLVKLEGSGEKLEKGPPPYLAWSHRGSETKGSTRLLLKQKTTSFYFNQKPNTRRSY